MIKINKWKGFRIINYLSINWPNNYINKHEKMKNNKFITKLSRDKKYHKLKDNRK